MRSSRSRRSWATEMAPGTLDDAGAGPARERGPRGRRARRGPDRGPPATPRRSRRWPSGSPTSARSASSWPPPTRASGPATSRSSTPSRRRIAPAAGLRARLDRPGARPAFRRWRRARSRPAGSSARSTISSASSREAIRISAGSRSTSTGRRATIRCAATPCRAAIVADAGQPFPFRHVEGEGLFEITVGPVHAGIIEPGHFRFTVEGETIVNLETRLGFVHKGTEKLFETLPFERTPELAERVSGDTSAGHALAYCQALEALGRLRGAAAGPLASHRPARARAALQPRGRRRHDRQRHGLRLRPRALLPHPRGAAPAERARQRPPPAARGDRAGWRRRADRRRRPRRAGVRRRAARASTSRRSRACRWPTRWCSSGCRGRGA